jgi:glycosyltransferase involved in cell wall biosynthesis
MHIAWVSIAVPAASPAGALQSALASVRYRMIQPKVELERLGHRVSFIDPRSPGAAEAARTADVLVFGKLMSQAARDGFVPTADAYRGLLARVQGPKVVFDVNDDYFDVPAYAGFYRGEQPDAWTTSTGTMAEVLVEFAQSPIHVVPEPFEGPHGEPRAPAPKSAGLLWFGHPTSVPELAASMDELVAAGKKHSLHLRCLTAPGHGAEQLCRTGTAGLRVSFEPWSAAATWRALQACDLVILPAKLSRPLARAKSANRMIESLRAGRFALAHPRPAYLELADYSWVGESLAAGIDWALAHPRRALARITAGQGRVEAEYSPSAIAGKWIEAFRAAGAHVN